MSFSTVDYWANCYRKGKSKEWYLDVEKSSYLFEHYLELAKQHFCVVEDCKDNGLRILHLGCGDSPLPLELARRHQHFRVHSVDFEPGVIATMQQKYGTSDLTWAVEDVRSLSLATESFEVVLDKGCFDALKVGQDSLKMLQELYRVLRPGGLFLCLSSNNVFLKKSLFEMGLPFILEINKLKDGHAGKHTQDDMWEDDELFLYHCRKPFFESAEAQNHIMAGGMKQAQLHAHKENTCKGRYRGALVLQASCWVLRWIESEGFEVTFYGRGGDLFYSSRMLRMEGLRKPLDKRGTPAQTQLDEPDTELPCLEVFLPKAFDPRGAHAFRKKERIIVRLPCDEPYPAEPLRSREPPQSN